MLHELAVALRHPASRDEVLRALALHAAEVGQGRTGVWLRDPSRPVLRLHGSDQEMPLGAPAPAARAFLERRPVVEAPPAPTVALPLFEARRVIGVLTLARDGTGAAIDPESIAVLEMALDVASLALASAIGPAPPEADQARAEAIAAVTAEICACESIDEIVDRTLATTGKTFGVERAAVWLIEPHGPPRAISRGLDDEFIRTVNDSYGKSVNWTSLQALRPVLIRDLSDARAATLRESANRAGLRSCLLIPLGFRGQLVGVLGLYSGSYWPWTDEDVAMARSFGLQLGGALAHSRLVGETRRQLARLDALAEVGRAAVEAAGIEGRSRRVMRALVRSGEVDAVIIYLLDPLRGDLALAAQHPPAMALPDRVNLSEDHMITRAVTGVRLVTSDDDIPESAREGMRAQSLQFAAAMPLVQRGKLIGVISVGTRESRLSPDALDFVRAVADQLVGSIEVGRVFDEHAATSARLRSILACAPDGMLVLSADKRVAYANPQLVALLGYEGDITGWTLEDFARDMGPRLEDPEVMARIQRHVREEPHLPHRDEFVIARPMRRTVERISAPVVGEDGQHIGQIVIYHEIVRS